MRNIYLIRHGKVNYNHRCVGQTDLPLEWNAYEELKQRQRELPKGKYEIFTSPLKRARQTANYYFMEERETVLPDFIEISVGDWENLSFGQIKEMWPEVYEERGIHPFETRIPGGESYEDVANRCEACLNELIRHVEDDIAIVTHSGCIKGLLCKMGYLDKNQMLTWMVPYGSVTTLQLEDREEFLDMYDYWEVPAHIKMHMVEVAKLAGEIVDMLAERGILLDKQKIMDAALVHDIARLEHNHQEAGAKYLRVKGYEDLAELVEVHHDFGMENPAELEHISEKMILYYADKRVNGSIRVDLEQRFEQSRKKCKTLEAIKAFEKRYEIAKQVEKLIYNH